MSEPAPRNPGPSWGIRAVETLDRVLPGVVFRPLVALGTVVAIVCLAEERRHSRAYLTQILPRRPTFRDLFRHFFAFTETLILKLQIAGGRQQEAHWGPGSEDFQHAMASGQQSLLGSLHLGHSDLTGFMFARRLKHRIAMVREKRGNSQDVDRMLERFGGWVTLIWVNESENLLFALKNAVQEGRSIAMKCDRHEFSAKTHPFQFLGGKRLFPTTIYHLSLIFQLPVLHAFSVPGHKGESIVYAAPAWRPDPARSRNDNLAAAHVHFQAFLDEVERVLRQQPYQWFNFTPLNPLVP
jgi:predicted LPLAT superfamily acyltransferase